MPYCIPSLLLHYWGFGQLSARHMSRDDSLLILVLPDKFLLMCVAMLYTDGVQLPTGKACLASHNPLGTCAPLYPVPASSPSYW